MRSFWFCDHDRRSGLADERLVRANLGTMCAGFFRQRCMPARAVDAALEGAWSHHLPPALFENPRVAKLGGCRFGCTRNRHAANAHGGVGNLLQA